MFDKLKQATAPNHMAVEKILVTKLKSLRNENDYGNLLSVLYDFHGPLEKKTFPFIPETMLPDISSRKKAENLKTDMVALKYSYEPRPSKYLPEPLNTSHAAGIMYVIEGSTLGGNVIADMLRKYLKVDENSLSYFTAYGNNTASKWQVFKHSLENKSGTLELNEMIAGANTTFVSLQKWLELNN